MSGSIKRLLADAKLRQTMGAVARQRLLDEFEFERFHDGLMHAYQDVLKVSL